MSSGIASVSPSIGASTYRYPAGAASSVPTADDDVDAVGSDADSELAAADGVTAEFADDEADESPVVAVEQPLSATTTVRLSARPIVRAGIVGACRRIVDHLSAAQSVTRGQPRRPRRFGSQRFDTLLTASGGFRTRPA